MLSEDSLTRYVFVCCSSYLRRLHTTSYNVHNNLTLGNQLFVSVCLQDAVKCLEEGKLEVAGVTLDVKTEIESKLSFSKEGDNWEAMSSQDGSLVVALDCTQDEAILSAGKSRELINHIQQLRKGADLELQDVVEVFFSEEEGVTIVEDAVASNVATFEAKFRGSIPLPKRFAPDWAVVIKSDLVDVGGSDVEVSICRPSVAAADSVSGAALGVFPTLEPGDLKQGQDFTLTVDGESYTLTEGKDFWLSAVSKVRSTKAVTWL